MAVSMMLFMGSSQIDVYASNALAAGTVIAIAPAGIATAIETPRVEASTESAVQMLTTPTDDPIEGGGPVASIYQTDRITLRLIQPATWVLRSPSAIAMVREMVGES
jgi:hypothetical protein